MAWRLCVNVSRVWYVANPAGGGALPENAASMNHSLSVFVLELIVRIIFDQLKFQP